MNFEKQDAQLFVSYSHNDKQWLDRIVTIMKPFVKKNGFVIWSDADIKPGHQWRQSIDKAITSANVALLLVSPDFFASEFIQNHELPMLLERQQLRQLRILWIAIRYSLYNDTSLAEIQALNDPSRPLLTLTDQEIEEEIFNICIKIKAVLQEENEGGFSKQRENVSLDRESLIYRELSSLDLVKRQLNKSKAKITKEMSDICNAPVVRELGEVLLMNKLEELFEEQLKYDVKRIQTIERIQNAGGTPEHYSLPALDDAVKTLKHRMEKQDKTKDWNRSIMEKLEGMKDTPIRYIADSDG